MKYIWDNKLAYSLAKDKSSTMVKVIQRVRDEGFMSEASL